MMSFGFTLMLTFQVILAVFLVLIILLQQGKGATAGASFGSGASSTVFGSRGSASFLSRTTAVAATLFLINSLSLAYFYGQSAKETSILDNPRTEFRTIEEQNPEGSLSVPPDVPKPSG